MQKLCFKKIKICMLSLLCFFLIACGPSEEKVAQAQEKYTELLEIHNEVVEAHNGVANATLDEALIALQDKITVIENYNLKEMKDAEIDLLIETMNSLIASYQEYHEALIAIRAAEDAAILIPIPIAVTNDTGFSFSSLSLYEQGSAQTAVNVLETLSTLDPKQSMTGLLILRDVNNTPWILSLTNAEGQAFELTLPVETYSEEGISLHLTYNSENATLEIEKEE